MENIRVEWEVSYPSRTFATSTKRSLFYKYLGMCFYNDVSRRAIKRRALAST